MLIILNELKIIDSKILQKYRPCDTLTLRSVVGRRPHSEVGDHIFIYLL